MNENRFTEFSKSVQQLTEFGKSVPQRSAEILSKPIYQVGEVAEATSERMNRKVRDG